jgi:3-methyl-2-oxobutanoate hydroxymethyltransferase
MSYLENRKALTLFELGKMRDEGRKIAMLTAYDASFAAVCGVVSRDVV